jgi:hypothetical protein
MTLAQLAISAISAVVLLTVSYRLVRRRSYRSGVRIARLRPKLRRRRDACGRAGSRATCEETRS